MKILLDTNFIITCAKQGIDFDALVNGMVSEDVSWLVPFEVLAELRGLKHADKMKKKELDAIGLGIEMVQALHPEVVKLSSTRSDVDTKIVHYIKDTSMVLATLDKGLKKRVKNTILTIRAGKKLAFV